AAKLVLQRDLTSFLGCFGPAHRRLGVGPTCVFAEHRVLRSSHPLLVKSLLDVRHIHLVDSSGTAKNEAIASTMVNNAAPCFMPIILLLATQNIKKHFSKFIASTTTIKLGLNINRHLSWVGRA